MFIPNRTCSLRRKRPTTNGYGEIIYGSKETIKFALVRFDLKIENSTVRADSSASRGNVNEFHASGRILVPVSVNPTWGDLVIIDRKVFKIKEVEPRYNVLGIQDHFECDLTRVEDNLGDEV